jgi:hypothetical protein
MILGSKISNKALSKKPVEKTIISFSDLYTQIKKIRFFIIKKSQNKNNISY